MRLPIVILVMNAYEVSQVKYDRADLHSDAMSHAQVHSGATVYNLKSDTVSKHVALSMYQLGSGSAADSANGHLDALEQGHSMLTAVMAALADSPTAFAVEPSHLLIDFFQNYVKDHHVVEHACTEILNELRRVNGVEPMLEVGCAMHKRSVCVCVCARVSALYRRH
jgi:hypothetical protein